MLSHPVNESVCSLLKIRSDEFWEKESGICKEQLMSFFMSSLAKSVHNRLVTSPSVLCFEKQQKWKRVKAEATDCWFGLAGVDAVFRCYWVALCLGLGLCLPVMKELEVEASDSIPTQRVRTKRCACSSLLDSECHYFCHLDIIWVNTPRWAWEDTNKFGHTHAAHSPA